MEGFELIATGLWSIVPPILALVLALITKEVYSSLTIGVFTGMIIYQFTLNGAGGEQLVASFTMVPQMMAEQIAGQRGAAFVPCASGERLPWSSPRRAAPAPMRSGSPPM